MIALIVIGIIGGAGYLAGQVWPMKKQKQIQADVQNAVSKVRSLVRK